MFARSLFVTIVTIGVIFGLAGVASAQEIIYQPLLVTPLKSVVGFHPEDAAKYKQAQRIADYAHTGAAVSNNDRDILFAQFQQYLADAAYLGAKLIPIAEALKAKLDGHSLDEDVIDAWASTLTQFATAVFEADKARKDLAESRHFAECDKLPWTTQASHVACIADIRDQQTQAMAILASHTQTLDTLIGGTINLSAIRGFFQ